jgi:hypothetical protein
MNNAIQCVGYVACGCRDCFDIAIGDCEAETLPLCASCEEACCDEAGESECRCEHAYGGE